jgi:hypothetical protein
VNAAVCDGGPVHTGGRRCASTVSSDGAGKHDDASPSGGDAHAATSGGGKPEVRMGTSGTAAARAAAEEG